MRKCASAIFVLCTSDISSMRYAVNRAIYGFRREESANIISQKPKAFISLSFQKKISLQTQFAISLLIVKCFGLWYIVGNLKEGVGV